MAAASLHRLRQIGGPDDRAQPCQRQRTDSTRCPRHRDSSLGTLLFPDIWRGAIHGTFVDHTDPRLSQQCLAPYGIGWCWLHPCGTTKAMLPNIEMEVLRRLHKEFGEARKTAAYEGNIPIQPTPRATVSRKHRQTMQLRSSSD
ncbi:uncharacterized protein [Dermacentor albipictus]|uniref:uncharacterized protein isoform X5 n=1 Tax=Dermacentor albipictus TaxID=60249 RepID=UPI0038FD35AD